MHVETLPRFFLKMNEWMNELILHCGIVPPLKNVFRTTSSGIRYRWQPGILFDTATQPVLEYRWIDSIHNCSCEHSSKLQLSIRFTPSRCLDVRQDRYSMYYQEGMKARVSPVQSIEPHGILAPTRDLNQEPPGPESRVVTTILPLHTMKNHSYLKPCN